MSKIKRKQPKVRDEADSIYFLKLVLYLIVGSQWVFLVDADLTKQWPVPLGLIVGLLFTTHEHFKLNRKIEYAVLLVAMLIGFWSHTGVYLRIA